MSGFTAGCAGHGTGVARVAHNCLAGMCAKLGVPVLFRQQRPGFQSRPFLLYKFRTMTAARDASDLGAKVRIGYSRP